jgi:hypothetical protein
VLTMPTVLTQKAGALRQAFNCSAAGSIGSASPHLTQPRALRAYAQSRDREHHRSRSRGQSRTYNHGQSDPVDR